MDTELLNRALRPGAIAALIVAGVLFLMGLGGIMLFRYAAFGQIDWQGLAAFCSMVLIPTIKWMNDRHVEKRSGVASGYAPAPTGGLVNTAAIS